MRQIFILSCCIFIHAGEALKYTEESKAELREKAHLELESIKLGREERIQRLRRGSGSSIIGSSATCKKSCKVELGRPTLWEPEQIRPIKQFNHISILPNRIK